MSGPELFAVIPPSTLAAIKGPKYTYNQNTNKTIAVKPGLDTNLSWGANPLAIRIMLDVVYNDGLYGGFPMEDRHNLVFDLAPQIQSHLLGIFEILHLRYLSSSTGMDKETIEKTAKSPPEGDPNKDILSITALKSADKEMLTQTGISALGDPRLRELLLLVALHGALRDAEGYAEVARFLASAGRAPERSFLSGEINDSYAKLPRIVEIELVRNGWWTPNRHHVSWVRELWNKEDDEEENWKRIFDAMVEAGWFHKKEWKYLQKEVRTRVLIRVAEKGTSGLMDHVLKALPLREMDRGLECDLLGSAVYNGVEMVEFLLDKGLDQNLVDDRHDSYRLHGPTTVLHMAVRYGKVEMVRLLLERGAKMVKVYGLTPLEAARKPAEPNVDAEARREVAKLLEGCLTERKLPLGHFEKPSYLSGRNRKRKER